MQKTEKRLALQARGLRLQFYLNQRVPMWGTIPEMRLTCHNEDVVVFRGLPFELILGVETVFGTAECYS